MDRNIFNFENGDDLTQDIYSLILALEPKPSHVYFIAAALSWELHTTKLKIEDICAWKANKKKDYQNYVACHTELLNREYDLMRSDVLDEWIKFYGYFGTGREYLRLHNIPDNHYLLPFNVMDGLYNELLPEQKIPSYEKLAKQIARRVNEGSMTEAQAYWWAGQTWKERGFFALKAVLAVLAIGIIQKATGLGQEDNSEINDLKNALYKHYETIV